jgi:hypothetical protein
MKKTSRIEVARDIVSYVRKEMDRPRLTESVRNSLSDLDAPPPSASPIDKLAAISTRE